MPCFCPGVLSINNFQIVSRENARRCPSLLNSALQKPKITGSVIQMLGSFLQFAHFQQVIGNWCEQAIVVRWYIYAPTVSKTRFWHIFTSNPWFMNICEQMFSEVIERLTINKMAGQLKSLLVLMQCTSEGSVPSPKLRLFPHKLSI